MLDSCITRVGALCGVLALSGVFTALSAAPELRVERNGVAVAVSSLQGWTPSLKSEVFSVGGQLAELAPLSYSISGYTLRRPASSKLTGSDVKVLQLDVSLVASSAPTHDGKTVVDEFAQAWPGVNPDDALVLIAWVSEGSVSRFAPLSFSKAAPYRPARFSGKIDLKSGEEDGYPLLLCWSGGRFVPGAASEARGLARRAATMNDKATLLRLAGEGIDLAAVDAWGNTLAHDAAGAGAVDCLKLLAERKVALRTVNAAGFTPLEVACSRGRTRAVGALLANGVAGGRRTQDSQSPLYLASIHGHLPVVRALLAAKVQPDEVTASCYTAISGALNEAHTDVADTLLMAKATFDFSSENSHRVLLWHCSQADEHMVRYFLLHGTKVKKEIDGRYPLVEAARKGSAALATLLLQAGAQPEVIDEYGKTPLVFACIAGNAAFAKALLAAGAKVNGVAGDGGTALHAATRSGNTELVEALLKAGARPDARQKHGLTPLELGVIVGSWDVVECLVRAGARLDRASPFFGEQLESVLRGDHEVLLAQLLQSGLSPDHKLVGEWTLRRLAKASGASRCERLLAEAGAVLDEEKPARIADSKLDPGFKLLSGQMPEDPRPDEPDLGGADLDLRVLIGPDGVPAFVEIEQCTDKMLCLGLTNMVKSWRFTPPTRQGRPVAVWASQQIHYASMRERMLARPQYDVPPKLKNGVKPKYPFDARVRGQMGEVVLAFRVDETGRVRMPMVVKSSGLVFEQPALDAIRKFTFTPAMSNSKPVPCVVHMPIIFSLNP